MQVIFTGRGTSGSYQIRAVQLGTQLGATVKANATVADLAGHDVAVVVKRIPAALRNALKAWGGKWVWDVVDAFPQPTCTGWTRADAIDWLHGQIDALRPTAIIWPNQRMRDDADVNLPGMVLKHHYRPGIEPNPIRETVATVGYEGGDYLGGWRESLESECGQRGWKFVTNPARMADLDIVVAFRGRAVNGYCQRNWKSAVKMSNAHGSGTPFVGANESGYIEAQSGAEYWATNEKELRMCFDWLTPQSTREQVSERFHKAAYPIERAAADLSNFLSGL